MGDFSSLYNETRLSIGLLGCFLARKSAQKHVFGAQKHVFGAPFRHTRTRVCSFCISFVDFRHTRTRVCSFCISFVDFRHTRTRVCSLLGGVVELSPHGEIYPRLH